MKKTFLLIVSLLTFSAQAHESYYPQEFHASLEGNGAKNEELKEALFRILATQHQTDSKTGFDKLGCERSRNGLCYSQKSLDYHDARKILFGKLHLDQDSEGYFVKDVYCRKEFRGERVKPSSIPNGNQINCEHTWPQSKFSSRFPKDIQKTDLHHLYPTDSRANSKRGNYSFGERSTSSLKGCKASRNAKNGNFEPPMEHKGNVARALFYFSVRYQMPLNRTQEQVLKRWNLEDPVDADERDRNEKIAQIQRIRNPFIDYPHLANSISDL